ncbi:MAG: hypothetical protein P8J20_03575 [Novosphingobium sp.]|nr:hypothetical protein [Novosphingobium sp.]
MDWLELLAQLAAIATAVIATVAAGWVWLDVRRKRRRLEDYLKAEMATGGDKGQRTILHLMAKLGLTESEILHASFRSNKIIRRLSVEDGTGHAHRMLLEYRPDAQQDPAK